MGKDSKNKPKNTAANKKQDGKFGSKNISHDPSAESARAVYGLSGGNPEAGAENPGKRQKHQ